MTNKGSSNRFLICFRPVTAESTHRRTAYTGNPKSSARERVLTSISVAGDDMMPKIFSSKKQHASSEAFHCSRSEKSVRRNLSQIIKSIVSETLPMKKVRNRKTRQDPNRTSLQLEGSVSARSQNPFRILDDKSEPGMCRKSPPDLVQKVKTTDVSPPLSSSSSLSSRRCCYTSPSTLSSGKRRGNYDPATVLYLMAVSLSVLVIWGRLCAILWTSTWFFFLAPREGGKTSRPRAWNGKGFNFSRRLA